MESQISGKSDTNVQRNNFNVKYSCSKEQVERKSAFLWTLCLAAFGSLGILERGELLVSEAFPHNKVAREPEQEYNKGLSNST